MLQFTNIGPLGLILAPFDLPFDVLRAMLRAVLARRLKLNYG